jgi:hypothetical protein
MKSAFAKPFDKLTTTRKYAQRLADNTGVKQVIVRCHPGSAAAACGMRFGVLAEDEIQPGDPIVETIGVNA